MKIQLSLQQINQDSRFISDNTGNKIFWGTAQSPVGTTFPDGPYVWVEGSPLASRAYLKLTSGNDGQPGAIYEIDMPPNVLQQASSAAEEIIATFEIRPKSGKSYATSIKDQISVIIYQHFSDGDVQH